MKIINESKYKYLGTIGKYHVFSNILPFQSKEIVCVEEACYKKENGKVQYFNSIQDNRNELPLTVFAK